MASGREEKGFYARVAFVEKVTPLCTGTPALRAQPERAIRGCAAHEHFLRLPARAGPVTLGENAEEAMEILFPPSRTRVLASSPDIPPAQARHHLGVS